MADIEARHAAENDRPVWRDWETTAIGLADENVRLRKILDDAINGCSMEWIIEQLAHIDGPGSDDG